MASMANGANNSQGTHGNAVRAILLATLLVSVAAAWWLTQTRGKSQRVAKQILADLRAGGLGQTWGKEPSRLLLIGRDAKGKPVAWRVYLRDRTEQGYAGQMLDRFAPAIAGARWTLTEDASVGDYRSDVRADVRAAGGSTMVALRQGRITIIESRGTLGRRASAGVPDNYIPEGMRSAVMWEVARRGEEATFATTYDGKSIADARVQFATITMTPQGPRTVRVGKAAVYEFDEAGEVSRIDDALGITYVRVGVEELFKTFPEARRLMPETDDASEEANTQSTPAQ